MSTTDFLSGIPLAVDPAHIECQLARLWKPSAGSSGGVSPTVGAVTRACLSNVVVLLPDDDASTRASEILPGIARTHPSRMLLVARGDEKVRASVSAVCHLPRGGMTPVCCEQIILRVPPDRPQLIPGIVLALLVPDVPVSLLLTFARPDQIRGWTPPGASDAPHPGALLGEVPAQILFDSRGGDAAALLGVWKAQLSASYVVDDLAWWALLPWREILAEVFDEAPARSAFDMLRLIDVAYEATARDEGSGVPSAALLAGWLGSRLGFRSATAQTTTGDGFDAVLEDSTSRGRPGLRVRLRPVARGAASGSLVSVRIETLDDGRFLVVEHAEGMDALVLRRRADRGSAPHRLPLAHTSETDLIGRALEPPHRSSGVFAEALEVACKLFVESSSGVRTLDPEGGGAGN